MDGSPEGVGQDQPFLSRKKLILLVMWVVIFAIYLAFRLVQGIIWLTGRL